MGTEGVGALAPAVGPALVHGHRCDQFPVEEFKRCGYTVLRWGDPGARCGVAMPLLLQHRRRESAVISALDPLRMNAGAGLAWASVSSAASLLGDACPAARMARHRGLGASIPLRDGSLLLSSRHRPSLLPSGPPTRAQGRGTGWGRKWERCCSGELTPWALLLGTLAVTEAGDGT